MVRRFNRTSQEQLMRDMQQVAKTISDGEFTEEKETLYALRDTLFGQRNHPQNWRTVDKEITLLLTLLENKYIPDRYLQTVKVCFERLKKYVGLRGGTAPFVRNEKEEIRFKDALRRAEAADEKGKQDTAVIGDYHRRGEYFKQNLDKKLAEARKTLSEKEALIAEAADLPPNDVGERFYAQQIEKCDRDYNAALAIIRRLIDSIDITDVALRSYLDNMSYEMLRKYKVTPEETRDLLIDNIIKRKELAEAAEETQSIVRSAAKESEKNKESHPSGMAEIAKKRASMKATAKSEAQKVASAKASVLPEV